MCRTPRHDIYLLNNLPFIYGSLLGTAVTAEHTCRRKLTQLMSDHIFGDEHLIENLTVMHLEGVTDKFRYDGTPSGPRPDWQMRIRLILMQNLVQQLFFLILIPIHHQMLDLLEFDNQIVQGLT